MKSMVMNMVTRKFLFGIMVLLSANAVWATMTTTTLKACADTFVLNPTENITNEEYGWSNATAENGYGADQNFGAAGSLSVASSTASQQKGDYITLLEFNFSAYAGQTVTSLSLTLNLSCGNSSAYGVFNYPGSAGDFDILWFSDDWTEGSGAPHAVSTSGITYNSLVDLLGEDWAGYLQTFTYDSGSGSYTFTFDLTSGNCDELLEAIYAGDTLTLMLAASENSDVAFNLTGRNNAYVTISTVPEPATMALLLAGSVLSLRKRRK